MSSLIFRIYSFLLKLIKAKWTFRSINSADILIFDQMGSEYIVPYINSKIKYEILSTRYERLNIFLLFASVITSTLAFLKLNNDHKHIYKNYLIKLIKTSNPKIIITYIDNDLFFFSLKKIFPNICFIAIQNGTSARFIDFKKIDKTKKIDHFFCFSKVYARFYQKNFAKKSHITGSLKCNNFKKRNIKIKDKKRIVFISSFSGFKKLQCFDRQITHKKFYTPEYRLLPILFKFSIKNKINLSILLRNNKNKKEKLFYLDILKKNLNYKNQKYLKFYGKGKNKLSYNIAKKFDLVLSIDSALGIEILGLGIKSVFFPLRKFYMNFKTLSFGWPKKFKENGFCWTNSFSEKKINLILKKNLNMSTASWSREYSKNNLGELMHHDYQNNKTKKVISYILNSVLGDLKPKL